MKKNLSTAASLLLIMGLLSGCMDGAAVETPTETPNPTPTVSGEASLAPQPTPGAADNLLTLDPSQEPPLSEYTLATAVPEFLTEEQQTLYLKAYELYGTLLSDTFSISYLGGGQPDSLDRTCESRRGTRAEGRYGRWADFDAMVHSIFTDRFWQEKNQLDGEPLYWEENGELCYLDVSFASDINYNTYFQPTFELTECTDNEISFNMTCYYLDPFQGGFDNDEAWKAWKSSTYEYTVTFPLRMVKLEEGWRFDEFHLGGLDSA